MIWFLSSVPFFAPGMVVWAVIAVLGAARVAQRLGTSRPHAAFLVLAVGLVAMATLAPTSAALAGSEAHRDVCDLQRMALAPISTLIRPSQASLNVLLFVPLGLALGSLPWSRTTRALIVASLLAPIAIELIQLKVPPLGRGCESADIIDNTLGLLMGLALGGAGRSLLRWSRRATTRA